MSRNRAARFLAHERGAHESAPIPAVSRIPGGTAATAAPQAEQPHHKRPVSSERAAAPAFERMELRRYNA